MTTVDIPQQSGLAHVRGKAPWSARRRRFLMGIAEHSVLIAAALIFLLPFLFIVLTSLMTGEQSLSSNLWPHPFRWSNYIDIFRFQDAPMLRWLGNTLLYCVVATAGLLLSSIPVAYALARLRWRGRQAAFLIVLATMMLPQQVTVVPLYVMWSKVGLVGSLWPVMLTTWFGDAFSIFLLRQFFLTIPQEYIDAARVDGCGEFRILTTVVCRLAKPAIAAVTLFSVLYCFNDYFLPLLYVGQGDVSTWPVSIGLSQFRNLHQVQWNLTMAATVLVMAPVIVIFFLAQKVFVEGVTLTGVKG